MYSTAKKTFVTGCDCEYSVCLNGHWKEESLEKWLKNHNKVGKFRITHSVMNYSKYGLDYDVKTFYICIN